MIVLKRLENKEGAGIHLKVVDYYQITESIIIMKLRYHLGFFIF